MKRINVNLYPKDGYFFREQDNVKIIGKNWGDVVKQVVAYRARAKMPAGDPLNEVMAQACQRSPNYCHEQTQVVVPQRITMKVRALQWLNGLSKIAKDALEYVTPEEAKSRAQICATCPQNQSLGVTSCSSCKQTFTEYRRQLLGNSRVRDGRLGGCSVLGCDLVTAAHLDEVRLDNAGLPQHCWRKKII